jgi:hypothetical protein
VNVAQMSDSVDVAQISVSVNVAQMVVLVPGTLCLGNLYVVVSPSAASSCIESPWLWDTAQPGFDWVARGSLLYLRTAH